VNVSFLFRIPQGPTMAAYCLVTSDYLDAGLWVSVLYWAIAGTRDNLLGDLLALRSQGDWKDCL
jgi:hypothetical protein